MDFYLGRGFDAHWLGSIQGSARPSVLLTTEAGRRTLTATTVAAFVDAVTDVLVHWPIGSQGASFPRDDGWPWPTSHSTDWVVAFDPRPSAVFLTVGGGIRWYRMNPARPQVPAQNHSLGPVDIRAWLRDPTAPPSVPMPIMRSLDVPTEGE
jgi:hypothetical protein